jgi:hypothetical protein
MISMLINWLKCFGAVLDILKNRIAPLGYQDDTGFHHHELIKENEPR